jgi:hypothetical protein
MQSTGGLTREQRRHYHDDGFVRLPGFAPPEVCERMLDRVVEIARGPAPTTATSRSSITT